MNQLPAIRDYYARRINKCSQLYLPVPNDVERIGTLLEIIDGLQGRSEPEIIRFDTGEFIEQLPDRS